MRLQPKTVKIAALLGTGLLLVVVAFVAVMTVLIRDADTKQPEIAAYSHGKTVTVSPLRYCSLKLDDCTAEGTPAVLDVPRGGFLQLSLPTEISDAPWRLLTVSETADGRIEQRERFYKSGEAKAVTIEQKNEQLNGIEIQLPSAVVDENGMPMAHAIWSIKTA